MLHDAEMQGGTTSTRCDGVQGKRTDTACGGLVVGRREGRSSASCACDWLTKDQSLYVVHGREVATDGSGGKQGWGVAVA